MPADKFQNMSKAQTAKMEKRKMESKKGSAVGPQTFKEARAVQFKILPPSFSQKHLKSKKQIIDSELESTALMRKQILDQRQQALDSKRSGTHTQKEANSVRRSQPSQTT